MVSSSLQNIEVFITQLFGSCSSNLQSIFGNSDAIARYRSSDTSLSETTHTTEESSTNSNSKRKVEVNNRSRSRNRRSKSTDVRRRMRSRETSLRRHRCMSKSYAISSTSIVPKRENTEIAVTNCDDDVSAISAHTLNEMYREELQRLKLQQIQNVKNAQMQNTISRLSPLVSPASDSISPRSSGTTEFESIWKTDSVSGSPSNSNVDNYYSDVRRDPDINSGSIYRDTRINRQKDQLKSTPFATIDENDSLYLDEQEI